MPLLNALSVPRGLATFPRKWLKANCLATDSVGDCVYVTGDAVGGFYQVSKSDPRDQTKMPSIGIITVKKSPTECRVQFIGEVHSVYVGLIPRSTLFVGSNGRLSETPPDALVGGYAFVQPMGTAASSSTVVMLPSLALTKKIG
jgi:hypothetical protein